MKFNWQKLLKKAVYDYDIPAAEFWNMTFGELVAVSDAKDSLAKYKRRNKHQ